MSDIKSYEDLTVYQKSLSLSVGIIKLLLKSNIDKRFEFVVNQTFRAVASIGASIAEGYGRNSRKSYRQFLSIARGSSFELDYWINLIIILNLADKNELIKVQQLNVEVAKMLSVMVNKL